MFRDLLGKDVKKKLDLRENSDKGIYVDGISNHPVHNTQVSIYLSKLIVYLTTLYTILRHLSIYSFFLSTL